MKYLIIAPILIVIALMGWSIQYKRNEIKQREKIEAIQKVSMNTTSSIEESRQIPKTFESIGIEFDFPKGVHADGLEVKDSNGNVLFKVVDVSHDPVTPMIFNSLPTGEFVHIFSSKLTERKIGNVNGIERVGCAMEECFDYFYYKFPNNGYGRIELDGFLEGHYAKSEETEYYPAQRNNTFKPDLYTETLATLRLR